MWRPNESVAFCVVVKNVQFVLREWMLYHNAIGVSHFYLFDNNNPAEENLAEVLKPLDPQMYTLISSPLPLRGKQQLVVYEQCRKEYGSRHDWMMQIDADEWVVIKGDPSSNGDVVDNGDNGDDGHGSSSSSSDNNNNNNNNNNKNYNNNNNNNKKKKRSIHDLLRQHSGMAEVSVYWYETTTHANTKRVGSYLCDDKVPFKVTDWANTGDNREYKSLFRPAFFYTSTHVHYVKTLPFFHTVASPTTAVIYHFYHRSLEDFMIYRAIPGLENGWSEASLDDYVSHYNKIKALSADKLEPACCIYEWIDDVCPQLRRAERQVPVDGQKLLNSDAIQSKISILRKRDLRWDKVLKLIQSGEPFSPEKLK